MKKTFLIILLALAIGIPVYSFAAEGDYDPLPYLSTCITLDTDLRYRSRDAITAGQVSLLQDYLNSAGYLTSAPTGFFGKATLQAVKDFQNNNYLADTGYVGPLTREKIRVETCTQPGITPPTVVSAEPMKIISPTKNTVVKVGGDYVVQFTAYPGADQYLVWIGNRISGKRYNAMGGNPENLTATLPMNTELFPLLLGSYTADQIKNAYYIDVTAIKNSYPPGNEKVLSTVTSDTFTILPK